MNSLHRRFGILLLASVCCLVSILTLIGTLFGESDTASRSLCPSDSKLQSVPGVEEAPCFLGTWNVLGPGGQSAGDVVMTHAASGQNHDIAVLNNHAANVHWQVINHSSVAQWGIRVEWPPTSPWFGTFLGTASKDARSITFIDGATWVRVNKSDVGSPTDRAMRIMASQYWCTVQALENMEHGVIGAEGCQNCNCTVPPPGALSSAFDNAIWFQYVFAALFFLVATFVVPVIGRAHVREDDRPRNDEIIHVKGIALTPEFYPALQFPRFLGALHIIGFHFYTRTAFNEWGFSWVSWFFLVSGFVLARARTFTERRKPYLAFGSFILARLVSIWPLHMVVIMVSEYWFGHGRNVWNVPLGLCTMRFGLPSTVFGQFLSNVFLVHSWSNCSDRGYWNHVSWFLGTLFAYWLLFEPFCWVVGRTKTRTQTWCILGMCWLWSGVGFAIQRWNSWSPFNHMDSAALVFSQVRFTHPVSHFQTFLAGIVLAKLHVSSPLLQDASTSVPSRWERRLRMLLSYQATASTCILLLVFFFYRPWRFYLFWWNGGLLPLHASLILGLAGKEDPLARLWSRWPFVGVSSFAYALYITQVIAEAVFVKLFGDKYYSFPIALAFSSIAGYYAVERPCIWLYKAASRTLKGREVDKNAEAARFR